MLRLILEVVEGVARAAPLVITELVKAAIRENDVLVTARAVTSIRYVLRMVRAIDRRCVYHFAGDEFRLLQVGGQKYILALYQSE